MTWETWVFIPVAGLAFGYSFYRLWILFRLMKEQAGKDSRIDQIGARIQQTLVNVFGQKAVLKKKGPGIIHAVIFWGFLVITVGTIEQFLTTLYAPAHIEFIGEAPYQALVFLQDLFCIAVLLACCFAMYRRVVIKPKHLGLTKDAIYILIFTGGLMASILLMNGFNILGKDLWFQNAIPFSLAVAKVLSSLSLDSETYTHLGTAFKWVHMLIVMGFAVYIPGSKHLHIIAAGPNTFFKNLDRPKAMKPINFEDETLEQYGAGKVTDMSWKDVLDMASCTECGRCQELCPAWNTDKPLSPMHLVNDLKKNLLGNQANILGGKKDEVSHVIDSKVTEDVIWACTSCRACEIACPVFIEHTDKIYDVRRNLVMMESKFPTEVQTVFKNMETNATPWAFSSEDRDKWAQDLEVKRAADVQEFDVLLWVGCAGSYDDRNKKVLRSFVNLLNKADVQFAILGNEEMCTGDPARRIGNEYLFQTLAQQNVETLGKYKFKKIVTSCPHCFNTLKNEYKDFGGNYEVVHHSQFLAQLISSGKIKPSKSLDEKITFHDSCYLGRWNDEYESPRAVLGSIPSAKVQEIETAHHDKSLCCGAGGGRMFMEETIGERINMKRTDQALENNPDTISASCPFCLTMITDGVKTKEMQDKVQVKDIAELLDETVS